MSRPPRRPATLAALVGLVVGGWGLSACSTGPTQPPATEATCAKAFKAAGGVPSDDTSSIGNAQKLQFILDECPSKAAFAAAVAPYLPAGQDRQAATSQAEQTFADVCQQLGSTVKSPLCGALG